MSESLEQPSPLINVQAFASDNTASPPPDAQAMTREQVEEIIEGGDAETFLRHDAAQRETIRRLETELEEYRSIAERIGAEKAVSQLASLQARLTASEARIRACTQTIIAEIGSNGPENLEESIGRLITKLATLSLSQRKWTTARPTVAGWYWWRKLPDHKEEIVRLFLRNGFLCVDWGTKDADYLSPWAKDVDGEWQGPLTPGEE